MPRGEKRKFQSQLRTKKFIFTLPVERYQHLTQIAARENKSASLVVNEIINQYLSTEKPATT